MPALTPAEKTALQRAVSVHTGVGGTSLPRAGRALRRGWDALCEGGVVAATGPAAVPGWHPLVHGPSVPVTPLPDELVARTARCIHSGRPWDYIYIVQRGGERDAPREPKALQWDCVHDCELEFVQCQPEAVAC